MSDNDVRLWCRIMMTDVCCQIMMSDLASLPTNLKTSMPWKRSCSRTFHECFYPSCYLKLMFNCCSHSIDQNKYWLFFSDISTHFFFELLSFHCCECVGLWKENWLDCKCYCFKKSITNLTFAMTGIMLTFVWRPNITSTSSGLCDSN